MSTNLKLLNQNNKKIYGGGNVKQGLVPSGTKFYGMRLKTNLNRARNGSGNACKAYDGVCFEQFDRSTVCFGNLSVSLTGGTETTKGGYKPPYIFRSRNRQTRVFADWCLCYVRATATTNRSYHCRRWRRWRGQYQRDRPATSWRWRRRWSGGRDCNHNRRNIFHCRWRRGGRR